MIRRLAACLALLLGAQQAVAGSLATCTVASTPVGFGVYDPLSATARTSTGTVTVSCSLISGISLLVAYNIQLSAGSGSYTSRLLKTATASLGYNLYTDNTYATVWGDGTGATVRVYDSYLLGLGGAVINYTAYGRIPATQNVRAGSYSDTIIVTVTY
jgi:spore coat protein U-like protein